MFRCAARFLLSAPPLCPVKKRLGAAGIWRRQTKYRKRSVFTGRIRSLRPFSRAQMGWWTLAMLVFASLLYYGFRSTHFNFRGDDAQLYVGVKQLLHHGTFYRG